MKQSTVRCSGYIRRMQQNRLAEKVYQKSISAGNIRCVGQKATHDVEGKGGIIIYDGKNLG